jgi:Icc-related predicted phosphoesterase
MSVIKNIVISDLHGEFLDKEAFGTFLKFVKDYEPNNLIINGDLVDFYMLSSFDKNPDRKTKLQEELIIVHSILERIRDGVTHDFWKTDTGHLTIDDMLIMHGDSRLNGGSISKYAGFSAKNTMLIMQNNICIGHCHRLALIHHTTPNGVMIGLETGCLCMKTGTANWQQGFATFETYKGKTVNPRVYRIEDGMLIDNGVRYNKFGKNVL